MNARSWAQRLLDDAGFAQVRVPVAAAECDALADWAASGAVWLTGRPGGPPLAPPGGAATAARGAALAFAALSRMLGRDVHVAGHRLLGERAALAGLRRNGPWNTTGTCRAVRARSGWFSLNLARPDDVRSVGALVESDADDPPWEAVGRWARSVTAAEAVERAQLLGIPAGTVAPGTEVNERPPLAYALAGAGPPPRRPPLVVDLSALWAGPLCANLLGLAGARVVKVEAPHRLDGVRTGCPSLFELLHGGHESVLLDPRREGPRLSRLLDLADVVIASSRPRAVAQMGIDPLEVCRRSPTTWVAITAYGRQGPWENRVGFGDDVAMAASLAVRSRAGTPAPCGDAIADPLTGVHAAVGALAGYLRGGSTLVDVSMHQVVSASMAFGAPTQVEAVRRDGTWCLPAGSGWIPVAPPRARPPGAPAPSPGAQDGRWP